MSTLTEIVVCPDCGARIPLEGSSLELSEGPDRPTAAPSPDPEESKPRWEGSSADFQAASASLDPFLVELAKGAGTVDDFDRGVEPPLLPMALHLGDSRTDADSEAGRGGSAVIEALNLDDSRPSPLPLPLASLSAPPKSAARTDKPGGVDADFEPEEAGRGSSWTSAILFSYAIAVTVAFFWFVILPKLRGGGGVEGDLIPATLESRADSGRRADRSRTIAPVAPVSPDHLTTLGKPIKLGEVEVTALSVERRQVTLLRTRISGEVQRKREPDPCLVLRLRLRNVSEDLVFAPFDESFVRDPDKGPSDSFIEVGPKSRAWPYPLAVESEWSIEGQTFRELKPGETLETTLVSSTEAGSLEAGKLLWRIRLRTGIDQTEVVGVSTDVPKR